MADTERQRITDEEDTIISPPDEEYKWVIVTSCFILNASTWGIAASFAIYLSEFKLSSQFGHSYSASQLGLIGGLNFSCAMLVALPVTYLVHRFGIHLPLLLGCVLQCIGYVSASFASRVWHLYLTQGALVGLGIGCIIIPSTAVLSRWFSRRRRTIANGISSAGSGIGGMAFTWGTAAMIRREGLAWAFRITGFVALGATLVATMLLRDRKSNCKPARVAVEFSLLREGNVILLLSWAFISMLGYITLLFSLSDFALTIGLSGTQATDVVGFLNLGTAIGRPIIGILSDKTSKTASAGALTLLCGILCLGLWLPAVSYGVVTCFAIICGGLLGVFWMTIGPLCAEVAGLRNTQSLLALSWTSIIIPTACGEIIALQLAQLPAARVYLYPQLFAGCSYLLAGLIMGCLWLRMRKRT